MGINPEKSLKNSLTSMRESSGESRDCEFALPPAGLPACGEPYRPAGSPFRAKQCLVAAAAASTW